MNQRLLIALAIAATLAACSGGKSGKGDDGSQPIPTDTNAKPQPTSVVETERIDQGDAMVQARNRNAAGFQTDMASRTVTVTQPCFATADLARLDMLPPTPDEASRRDTSLIQELNAGTVFILRPGDKGVVEGTEKTKLLVRFQGGPLWVWRSDVAS